MDEQGLLSWFADLADRRRLGHAYILQHPDSARGQDIARTLAQSLLCAARKADGTPCRICSSCLQVQSGNHAGLTWLEPDGASLKIAQMRSALRMDRHQTGVEGMHIIVLSDAWRLTLEAGNAILKWVEEPAAARLFLFLTRSQSALLPTLRSRCQFVRLRAAGSEVSQAAQALRGALGEDRFAEAQKLMIELTLTWAACESSAWQQVGAALTKLKLTGDEALHWVDAWMELLRNLAVARSEGRADLTSVSPGLAALDIRATPSWLAQSVLTLAEERRRLQSHVNPALAFEALLIRSTMEASGGATWQAR